MYFHFDPFKIEWLSKKKWKQYEEEYEEYYEDLSKMRN